MLSSCRSVVSIYFPSPGLDNLLLVMKAPGSCGYRVNSVKNTLTVPFTGCNVKYVTEVSSWLSNILY